MKEYVHKKYIVENGIDISALPAELQAKLTKFDSTAEKVAALQNAEQQEEAAERLYITSKKLLDEIEEFEEDTEEAATTAAAEEKKKKEGDTPTEKKKSGGLGWVGWLGFGLLAVFGIREGMKHVNKK